MIKLRWFLFTALLALPAPSAFAADGDVVHIGRSIHVPVDAVRQDAVCIFCSVHVDGRVTGDIVTIFGNVHLTGDAQHDVVTIFGALDAQKGSSIDNDVVSIFGSVHLGKDVRVGHDLVAWFGVVNKADSATISGDTVTKSAWIVLIPLFILMLVTFLVVREIRTQQRRYALRRHLPTHNP